MSALDMPMPPLGDEPFDDEMLDRFLQVVDDLAERGASDDVDAVQQVGAWEISDDSAAEWAGRKLVRAHGELSALREQRDEWVRQIDEWLRSQSARHKHTVEFFTDRLEQYAIDRRAATGKATLSLPSITVRTSEAQPKVDVDDDEALAAFIERAIDVGEGVDAWDAALTKAEIDVDDVVKRSAKVYVGPLRKLVNVVEHEAGVREHLVLSCEHGAIVDVRDGDEQHGVGESFECSVCDMNPVTGDPEKRAIVDVIVEPIVEWVAVGPDGEPLVGVSVDPGGVTAKVVVP